MTSRPDPRTLLAALAEPGTPEHVEALQFITGALEQALTDPEAPALDHALGLTRSGPSLARQESWRRRDATLARIYRRHYANQTQSAAAREIAEAWSRYESNRYKHQRAAPVASPASEYHTLLEAGHQPLSPNRIRKALAQYQGPVPEQGHRRHSPKKEDSQ